MGRNRKEPRDDDEFIRLNQQIKCSNHPDIADLYRANHQRFVTVVRDALSFYAFMQKTTGARTLAEMMGSLKSGEVRPSADAIQPVAELRAKPLIDAGNGDKSPGGELSGSAAEVLRSYEKNM